MNRAARRFRTELGSARCILLDQPLLGQIHEIGITDFGRVQAPHITKVRQQCTELVKRCMEPNMPWNAGAL